MLPVSSAARRAVKAVPLVVPVVIPVSSIETFKGTAVATEVPFCSAACMYSARVTFAGAGVLQIVQVPNPLTPTTAMSVMLGLFIVRV